MVDIATALFFIWITLMFKDTSGKAELRSIKKQLEIIARELKKEG